MRLMYDDNQARFLALHWLLEPVTVSITLRIACSYERGMKMQIVGQDSHHDIDAALILS